MKECNQCGKCCIKYSDGALSATQDEMALWEIFNPDIFKYVHNNQIWHDPDSGAKLSRCPFLEVEPNTTNNTTIKYTCSIYEDRPEDCRHYPSRLSEMIEDECEMIEAVDLADTKNAQIKLDILMLDSRPPSI